MENKYDQFADIDSLEKQRERVLAILNEVEAKHKQLSELGPAVAGSTSPKGTDDRLKETELLTKAIESQKKQLAEMAIKLALATSEDAKRTEALKQTTSLVKGLTAEEIKRQKLQAGEYAALQSQKQANNELNKSIQLRIKLRESENGSIQQQELYYQKLYGIIKKLSADELGSDRGKALVKQAGDLKNKLNELKKGAGDFSSNVGRYAESLGGLFGDVREEISKLQVKQQELTKRTVVQGFTTPEQTEELNKTTTAITELQQVMAIGDNTGQSFNKTVRQIGFAFSNLSEGGNQSEEFLDKFKHGAAEAKDKADDLRVEIKALSSDTRGLDLATGALTTLVSGFEAAAGASALFGGNQEEAEKITKKLVAIQSVANGVREIGKQITERGTAANKAYNFVVQQGTVLFGKGSTAAQRFGAALKGIVILAVVGAIIALVQKMDLFNESTKTAAEKSKELDDAMKALNDTIEKRIALLGEAYRQNINSVNADLKLAEAQKKSAVELFELKRKIADNEKRIAQEQFDALVQRAETDDAARASGQRGLTAFIQVQDNYNKAYSLSLKTLESLNKRKVELIRNDGTKFQLENVEKEIEAAQSESDLYKSKYDEYTSARAALLGAQTNADALQLAETQRVNDEEKKAALELFKFRNGILIEQLSLKQSDDSINTTKTKIQAAEQLAQAQIILINKVAQYELSQNDLAASKIKQIREERAAVEYGIELALSHRIEQIKTNDAAKRRDEVEQEISEEQRALEDREKGKAEARQKAFEREQQQLETFRNEDEQANADAFKANLKTAQQYGTDKERIETDYQRKVLESQIRFYEYELKLLQDNGEDTKDALAAIAAAKAALATLGADTTKKKVEEEKAALDQLKEKYMELAAAVTDAFQTGVAGVFDAQKNKLQDLIDKNDELKEAEIARVNASTDAEATKSAKIDVIEKAAAARKEALERRQRQIDRQKAIFDRGFKIFEIITDNIVAINKIKIAAAAAVNPVVKALLLSQIPITIATGAVGLLSLLATPIPKYFTGTDYSKGGPAEVAEKGRELAVEPGGRVKLFQKHSVQNLIQGTKIYPNRVTEDILAKAAVSNLTHPMFVDALPANLDMSEVVYELKELNKKPPVKIFNTFGIESSTWYDKNMKN